VVTTIWIIVIVMLLAVFGPEPIIKLLTMFK
jgi:hypothetical protein